jgi:nucleoside-diphosphate-sugar epimerase
MCFTFTHVPELRELMHVKSLVQDLAKAFIKVLGHPNASQQIFNISGAKYVTFDGLARACAKVNNFFGTQK